MKKKKIRIFVCIALLIGLASGVLASSDLFGTIKQVKENEYTLNNMCLFETAKDFKIVYPNATIPNNLLGYKLEYILVTEDPFINQRFYEEVIKNKKLEWQHDLSLIDSLEVSYKNQYSQMIKFHYKDASEQFIPQLDNYILDKIQVGDITYNIYHDGANIKFITFKKELWGKDFNVHVELLKTKSDGSVVNQFEWDKNKNEITKFLQLLSLNNLIK
ncbi:hypothetical protein [Caloranaerobacter azorensis]|uniref:Uncharacterized protein n=1 Tax=Caloranaerobacter azorensis TaxID=116090 RepID=A0A6P1YBN1_9FIRM|nr:hypothetical protein [Caloranaerobacter azorensis]QIB26750.1 hypothetical protein G3A45_05205 [Caloranaerobacter azorensis]